MDAEAVVNNTLQNPKFVNKQPGQYRLFQESHELSHDELTSSLLELLNRDPAIYLERYGSLLGLLELSFFNQYDVYDVKFHLARLRKERAGSNPHRSSGALFGENTESDESPGIIPRVSSVHGPPPPLPAPSSDPAPACLGSLSTRRPAPRTAAQQRVRNRRFRKLAELEATEYFSDASMRMRAPHMFHEYVGRYNPGAGASFARDTPLSQRLLQNWDLSVSEARRREYRHVLRQARKAGAGSNADDDEEAAEGAQSESEEESSDESSSSSSSESESAVMQSDDEDLDAKVDAAVRQMLGAGRDAPATDLSEPVPAPAPAPAPPQPAGVQQPLCAPVDDDEEELPLTGEPPHPAAASHKATRLLALRTQHARLTQALRSTCIAPHEPARDEAPRSRTPSPEPLQVPLELDAGRREDTGEPEAPGAHSGLPRHVHFADGPPPENPEERAARRISRDRQMILHARLIHLMKRRFLDGDDAEFFDYATVDGDERLDDMEQESRDAEDAYFSAESPASSLAGAEGGDDDDEEAMAIDQEDPDEAQFCPPPTRAPAHLPPPPTIPCNAFPPATTFDSDDEDEPD